jgi:hypothetical protein
LWPEYIRHHMVRLELEYPPLPIPALAQAV